jgi:SAM-dependent methyltransferase
MSGPVAADSEHDRAYRRGEDGIYVPTQAIAHRDDEYDPAWFAMLLDMQRRHFWYHGRHRFLLYCLRRSLRKFGFDSGLSGVDLGGGCGAWIRYLTEHFAAPFSELALADSSTLALTLAADTVGPDVKRYQVDLLRLQWTKRWDVAFLLDVLEHIPPDADAVRQIRDSLRPGGLLIVTTPALNALRTYNDDLVHHVRRYSRGDYRRLADECGMEFCFARYFMFYLSPLLMLSRMKSVDAKSMTDEQVREHLARTHRVPSWPVNQALRLVFSAETPLGASRSKTFSSFQPSLSLLPTSTALRI